MNYGGTLKLIFNAQTKKTMQLPEYFLLQVKYKHNIYIYQQTISVIEFTQKINFQEKACQKTIESFF